MHNLLFSLFIIAYASVFVSMFTNAPVDRKALAICNVFGFLLLSIVIHKKTQEHIIAILIVIGFCMLLYATIVVSLFIQYVKAGGLLAGAVLEQDLPHLLNPVNIIISTCIPPFIIVLIAIAVVYLNIKAKSEVLLVTCALLSSFVPFLCIFTGSSNAYSTGDDINSNAVCGFSTICPLAFTV